MKLLVIYFLLFICLFGQIKGVAQNDTLVYKSSYPHNAFGYPKWAFKWNALTLIDVDATLQLAAERFLGKRWSVQQEIGYGWWTWNNSGNNTTNEQRNHYQTWRFRTEGRYYLSNFEENNFGKYVALEILYKQVSYPQTQTIGRNCMNGRCDYYEIADYLYVRRVAAGHIKVGLQGIVGKRFLVDFFAGIGIRQIEVRYEGLPKDNIQTYQSTRSGRVSLFNRQTEGNFIVLSGTLGLRIGYMTYHPKQANIRKLEN